MKQLFRITLLALLAVASFGAMAQPYPNRPVKVIIPFTDPVIVGEFVYHCHIMQHADQGMMANILVYDPAKPMPAHASCDAGGGNHGSHAGHGG